MLDEVTRGEVIEKELDAMIERRARQTSPEQERIEELWRESCRAASARERRDNRALWYAWHMDQADRIRRTMASLIEHHEAKALALLEEGRG